MVRISIVKEMLIGNSQRNVYILQLINCVESLIRAFVAGCEQVNGGHLTADVIPWAAHAFKF